MSGVLGAYRRVWANRPLRNLLAGEFISGVGDWLYLVAILLLIYERTNDPVVLGIVGAIRLIPGLVLSIPAGIIVDRFDRRLVLVVTDVARGTCLAVIAFLTWTEASVELIVAVAVVSTCFGTFFQPAIGAYLPSLVKDEADLGPANTVYASLDNVAIVIGPAIAGIVLAATGSYTISFLLDVVTFAVVAAIVWRLPSSKPNAAEVEAAAADGAVAEPTPRFDWRAIRLPVGGIFLVDIAGTFIFGGFEVLIVLIAFRLPMDGEAATGALNAAFGVGGFIGALIAGVLVLHRRQAFPLLLGSVLMAAACVVLGLSGSAPIAIGAMAILAVGSLLASIVTETLFQRIVPDEVRGRALGISGTVRVFAMMAGSLLLPPVATVLGVDGALVVCAAIMLGATVVGILALGPYAIQAPVVDARLACLSALPMLAGLPPARIETAERNATIVPMRAGDVVIRQGEVADRFFVIAEGEVEVTQVPAVGGEAVVLRRMTAGEAFGEIGLLHAMPRTATVTAVRDGSLVALDGADFLELVNGAGIVAPFVDQQRGPIHRHAEAPGG